MQDLNCVFGCICAARAVPNIPLGQAHTVNPGLGAGEKLRDNVSALAPLPPPRPRCLEPAQGVILPLCSSSHPSVQATPGTEGGIPGHTGGLQGSSWVASPGQDVSPGLGQSRERLRHPGPPPMVRQLREQTDQGVQGVQPGASGGKRAGKGQAFHMGILAERGGLGGQVGSETLWGPGKDS